VSGCVEPEIGVRHRASTWDGLRQSSGFSRISHCGPLFHQTSTLERWPSERNSTFIPGGSWATRTVNPGFGVAHNTETPFGLKATAVVPPTRLNVLVWVGAVVVVVVGALVVVVVGAFVVVVGTVVVVVVGVFVVVVGALVVVVERLVVVGPAFVVVVCAGGGSVLGAETWLVVVGAGAWVAAAEVVVGAGAAAVGGLTGATVPEDAEPASGSSGIAVTVGTTASDEFALAEAPSPPNPSPVAASSEPAPTGLEGSNEPSAPTVPDSAPGDPDEHSDSSGPQP